MGFLRRVYRAGLYALALVPALLTNPARAQLEIVQPTPGRGYYQQEDIVCRARWTQPCPVSLDRVRYLWSAQGEGPLGEGLETKIRNLDCRLHKLAVEAVVDDSTIAVATAALIVLGQPRQFTLSEFTDWEGEISPGGTTVAFTSFRSGDPEIWIASSAGQGLRRITYKGGWGPSWAPDGNRLAFWSERSGQRDIFLVGLDHDPATAVPLTDTPFTEWMPAFSPVKDELAFVCKDGSRLSINTLDLAPGAEPREIVGPERVPMFPRWFPGGEALLFTSFSDSLPRLCEVSLTSGMVSEIGGPGSEDADISPDGKLVVMVRAGDLWLLRLGDGHERPLTREGEVLAPRFSRDGKGVLYSSMRSGNYDLWLLDLPPDL